MSNPTPTKLSGHALLGQVYISKHPQTMYAREQWYRYDGTQWLPIHDLEIEREIWDTLPRAKSANTMRGVKTYIRSHLRIDSERLDADPNVINLENGIFDLSKTKLFPHNESEYLTTKLAFGYDPAAKCSMWQHYLDTTLVSPHKHDKDRELIAFLQEAIGYSLTTDVSQHVMFWCYGEGANGKGTLFHVIEKLLGTGAQALNLNILRKEQYQLALLAGKRVALCSESNAKGNMVDDAVVKALVAGDRLLVRMIQREPFELEPKCKLWWSMNRLPVVEDTSYGFWRRVRVIPFNRVFKDLDIIPDLKEKLFAELPGIFNWAIEGLLRLRTRGSFTLPTQVARITRQYQTESNPVEMFVKESLKRVLGEDVQSAEVYNSYRVWCSDGGYRALDARELKRELALLHIYSRHRNTGTVYLDVRFK